MLSKVLVFRLKLDASSSLLYNLLALFNTKKLKDRKGGPVFKEEAMNFTSF